MKKEKTMLAIKGPCAHNDPKKLQECFHDPCQIRRIFTNGRILLENTRGYVRAADLVETVG